jgi:uncharacterized protein (DUF433 family)
METISASYRHIVRSPDVRGGHARVEGTRIGVHDVIGLSVNGASVDEVCRSFPDLRRSDVYECLAYYEDHRAEGDATVRLVNGAVRRVEIHWYEAHGVGKRGLKIKRFLD